MRIASSLLLIGVTCFTGCVGDIGGGADGDGDDGTSVVDPGENPTSFACDPSITPSPTPLRRLSRVQYDNTLRELLLQTQGQAEAEVIFAALETPLTLVPVDIDPDHTTLNTAVTQPHIDGQYHTARAFAAEVTRDDARLTRLAGACATDADTSNDAACIDALIRSFGERAFRRPLETPEVDFYRTQVFGGTPFDRDAVADLVTVLLLSPPFLYHVEDGADAMPFDDKTFPLTGFELANRLSFHFWQSMPDEALLDAARDGSLETEAGYAAQVERLWSDPRTTRALDTFFKEWVQLDEIPDVGGRLTDPAFVAFANGLPIESTLRSDMIDEIVDLTRYYRDSEEGTLEDLFTSNLSFAKSEGLAAIYGVEPFTGDEPPTFPAGERSGLLTRAGLLSTAYLATRPIHKGVIIRRRILCDVLDDPPNNVGPSPELGPGMTVRERVTELTQQPGSNCAACHEQLNPLGFATENYDAIGRLRTEEIVYDAEGAVLDRRPIDATSVPFVDADDETAVNGGIELAARVVASDKVAACFSRHYFRFTWRRAEDFTRDACTLETYRTGAEGGSLRDMLKSAVLEPAFRLRRRD